MLAQSGRRHCRERRVNDCCGCDDSNVTDPGIEQIAELLRERNAIDERLAKIVSRPMTAGHLGEWLAARIFGIELEPTAVKTAFDGRFTSGQLQGRTVNVKWHLKRENLLDLYLFGAKQVRTELSTRGVRIGTASSVRATQWESAEIYPRPNNALITIEPQQVALLRLFAL